MIPLVGQACAIGDNRPFVSALLVLDPEVAPAWAQRTGIEVTDLAELAKHPDVQAEIEAWDLDANDGRVQPAERGQEVHDPRRGVAARLRGAHRPPPSSSGAASTPLRATRSRRGLQTVLKFVGWDRNGDPAAMLILATDLRHVSWISQEFYESRYPEQAARKAIFYVVAALVRPTARGSLWFRAVLLESIKYAASRRGVGCIDCCQHNVENVQIPRIVDRLSASVAEVEPQEIDTQSYFAYVYHGLKEHLARPAVIDITDDAVRRAEASARSASHRGVPTS
jgi:hypothetical protein